MPLEKRPRVLIMGACKGAGRACAQRLASGGAELILADYDGPELRALAGELGALARFCDILSEASVKIFAADVIQHHGAIDVLINAAGNGFERTLGMHRVSRALMPALKRGRSGSLIVNIPPPAQYRNPSMFAYASSWRAYERLCTALQEETKGSRVEVRTAGSPALVAIESADCGTCGSGYENLASLIHDWVFPNREQSPAHRDQAPRPRRSNGK